jgi:hypothetical protein
MAAVMSFDWRQVTAFRYQENVFTCHYSIVIGAGLEGAKFVKMLLFSR